MRIVVNFRALPLFKARYPRHPETVTLAESKEAIAHMLNDVHDLGLGRFAQSAITAILSHLHTHPAAARTAYEQARGVLFRALDEMDPEPWQLRALDPNGGFHSLSPPVLHTQPASPGTEPVAILAPDPYISAKAIDLAKRRLEGCPDGKEHDFIRDTALAPLVQRLVAAGNTPAAVSVWLRMAGFGPYLGRRIAKRSVRAMMRRIAALQGVAEASTVAAEASTRASAVL